APPKTATSGNGKPVDIEKFIKKVQSLMWQHVAVVRDGKSLRQVLADLTAMQSELPAAADRRSNEAANILRTGMLITRSAIAREESRGAHYRVDFPVRNDAKFQRHSVVRGESVSFE